MRPIGGLGRRDRRHGGRLHEAGRMRLRAGNTDRLQSVLFVQRLGDAAAFDRLPVYGLIGEFFSEGFWRRGRDWGRTHDRRTHRAAGGLRRARRRHRRIGERQPRRHLNRDPAVQRGDVGGDPQWRREYARLGGGALVDDGQSDVDGRAVLGVDRAVDRGGEDDTPALLQMEKGVGPSGVVWRETRAGDGDKPAAIG